MATANRFAALFKAETNVSSKSSYANTFPSLGKEEKHTGLETELKSEVIHRSSGKKTQTKIILGHRSYEDDLREKYPYYKQEDMSSQSTNAYNILADKEKLALSLVRSRMCISVDKNEKCQQGDNCRFAHSLDELKVSDCLFEQRCRFVRMSNGELINNGTKVCLHKHPHENTNTFMRRTGLDKYKCTSQVSSSSNEKYISSKIETKSSKTFIDESTIDKQISTNQMLVIRVPKELACQALEIAMKSGNKRIQIDIVK